MAAESATNNIPIEEFRPDFHDFKEWIGRFETAVDLATNAGTDDRKHALYKSWLPLRLDDATRMVLSSCDTAAAWNALKTELRGLLITDEEKYNWRAGKKKIVWDGKENFHVLAARVKRTIDMYEAQPRETDYYKSFREALPGNYRQAIDWGHTAETLAEAKRLAFKCQAALAGGEDGATGGKSVAFVGGSMDTRSQDMLKAIEMGLQGMAIKVENLSTEVAKQGKEAKAREERARSQSPNGEQPQRSQSRGRGGGPFDFPPRPRQGSDNYRRSDSRERYNQRYQEQDRYRANEDNVCAYGRNLNPPRDDYVGGPYTAAYADGAGGYDYEYQHEEYRPNGYPPQRDSYGNPGQRGGYGYPNQRGGFGFRGQPRSPSRGRYNQRGRMSPRGFGPNANWGRNNLPGNQDRRAPWGAEERGRPVQRGNQYGNPPPENYRAYEEEQYLWTLGAHGGEDEWEPRQGQEWYDPWDPRWTKN